MERTQQAATQTLMCTLLLSFPQDLHQQLGFKATTFCCYNVADMLILPDREGETIAQILQAYRQLVLLSTERITNKVSIGQAAHNSMAMQLETQALVRDLLFLHTHDPC